MNVKRILIIDDEDDIREVAKLSLEIVAGWEVLAARSGAEGLAMAEAEYPDAILLDVMMPEMDGPATLRMLQDNPATQKIPVILMTAKVQATDQEAFRTLRVASVIAKPFDPMQLATQVSTALGWVQQAPGHCRCAGDSEELSPTNMEASALEEARMAVAQLWDSFRDTIRERVQVLEEAVTALQKQKLSDSLRLKAEQEAHKLAGSLGTLGFVEGSKLAGTIEMHFRPDALLTLEQLPDLQEKVAALRSELEKPPTA